MDKYQISCADPYIYSVILSLGPGVADSLDDGMFVLLKKSDEGERDYSISNKRPNSKRGRKGRKQSVVTIIFSP